MGLILSCLEEYAADIHEAVFRHQATVRRAMGPSTNFRCDTGACVGDNTTRNTTPGRVRAARVRTHAMNRAVTPGGHRHAFFEFCGLQQACLASVRPPHMR